MIPRLLIGRLRLVRAERGLSLREAAKVTGVTPETLSELERGVRTPQPGTLYKVAHGYGIPVTDLLEVPELVEGPEFPLEHTPSEGPAPASERAENLRQYRQMLDLLHDQILDEAKAYTDKRNVDALSILVVRTGFEAHGVEQFMEEEGVAAIYEEDDAARRVYAATVRLRDLIDDIDETVTRLQAEGVGADDNVVVDFMLRLQRGAS